MCILSRKALSRSKTKPVLDIVDDVCLKICCLTDYPHYAVDVMHGKHKRCVKQLPVGVVSRHDVHVGVQLPLAAVCMLVSFEEFSVLL